MILIFLFVEKILYLFQTFWLLKEIFVFSRKHPVYKVDWWPRVELFSISIKDGAHVSLHENAAGILKWFEIAQRDAHDLRINGFAGSVEKPRARRMSTVKYSIVYSAGVAVW